MAGKERGGPRQPLSRVRPKDAMRKAAARPASRPKTVAGRPKPKKRAATRRAVRPRLTSEHLAAHAALVYERLAARYPDAHCELDFQTPWQLLVATILSAQCTDQRVNMVTPGLFQAYPTPAAMAAAPQEAIEEIIRSTGFFRNKAKNIIAMSGALVDRHGGSVPASMDELVVLPGVGRKTANVVLGNACGINAGIAVDTHVLRVGKRLGLTTNEDPIKVEQDLMKLVPQAQWTMISHLLIWHGRRTCHARKPMCGSCPLAPECPSAEV